jgi:hypothetical protein
MQNEHKQVLFIEIRSDKIQHKSAKGEIDLGLVLFVEVDDELFVVEDFLVIGRVDVAGVGRGQGLDHALAELLGALEQFGLVLVAVLVVVVGQELVFLERFDDVVGLGDSFEQGNFGDGDLLKLFFLHLNLVLGVVVLKVLVVDFLFVLPVACHIRVVALIVVKLSRHIYL